MNELIDPTLPLFMDEPTDINDAGQITAIGFDNVLVEFRAYRLTPKVPQPVCQEDLGFAGPGTLALSLCGDALAGGGTATLTLEGAPAGAPLLLLASASFQPTAKFGGTIVPVPATFVLALQSDGVGGIELDGVPGGGGPLAFYVQVLAADPAQPKGVAISNALQVELLP